MNASTWLALVALTEPVLPDPLKITAACDAANPDAAPLLVSSETASMVTFAWGESTVAYTLVAQPIPAEQLAGPASRAWYWPEAAEHLSGHQAHLIVALVNEGSDRIAKSMQLTRFVAALLPSSEAVGVQWGGSRAVHQSGPFCETASQMARDDMPLHLWLDFQVESNDSGGLQLYTTGMEAFGKPEIEVAHFLGAPQDLMNHAYNLAHYVLEKDAVIKDGEAIGLPGEIQVTAKETTTLLQGEQRVWQFDFE